jgi:hypothetical protein
MALTKVLVLDRKKILALVQFVALVGVATITPLWHQQWLTGPLVNAVLFISVIMLGTQSALMIGLLPSTIALSVGTLPPVLAPMIPFIILGNSIMVISFAYFKEKNYWLAIGLASFLKAIWLLSTSSLVVNLLLKKEVAVAVANMMSWPQLITALLGGLIAYLFLRMIKKV